MLHHRHDRPSFLRILSAKASPIASGRQSVTPPISAVAVTALLLSTAFSGCTGEDPNVPEEEVSYHTDIRPLLEQHCVACHVEGNVGPFPLDSYAAVEEMGASVVDAVANRRMPPWRHNPDCRPAKDATRLTDDEISKFLAWADADFAEGDPSSFVEPSESSAPLVRAPDIIVAPPVGYAPDVTRPDDYRCLPLDLEFPEDAFITATTVAPDQKALVHHVILYAVPQSEVPTIEALDAAEEGPGYTCFGGSGTQLSSTLGGWTPGEAEPIINDDAAFRVPAGSKLVMQMHYNVVGLEGAAPPDQSELEIWLVPEGQPPSTLLSLTPVADTGLRIVAGDEESVQVSERHLTVDGVHVVGSSPHMHLLGRSLRTEVIRADGTVECLSDIDDWDFAWQRAYVYEDGFEVPLSIDDTVRITCTYDNSAANQPVVNGERVPPRDVTWGEGTFDEMCLDYLVLAAPFQGADASGLCAGYRECSSTCSDDDGTCHLTCLGNQGFGCSLCGLDVMFGDCAVQQCVADAIAFNNCFQGCPDRNNDNFGSCFSEQCKTEYDAYMGCLAPHIASGTCADDFAACGIDADD